VSASDPVTQSDRRRVPVGRVVLAVGSVLTLVATVLSGAGWLTLTKLTSNIATIDVTNDLGSARPTKVAPSTPTSYEPLNILIMGTDTRTGQGRGFGSAADTSSGSGHSDTVILLHVSGDRTWSLGVSLPRDSWVTRPECGANSAGRTITGKFNAAFAVGGPGCTIKAVEALTQVRIDHFVVVDFSGFKAVVDSLGGVPICLAHPINDIKSHFDMPAGTHVLNGDQALAFARLRHNIGDGSDTSRIDRQQVFMSSVVRTATSAGVLTDPLKLYDVLDSVTKSLTVDKALGSVDALKSLALSLQGLSPRTIKFMTVPWVPRGDGENVVWEQSKADKIWQAFRDDTQYPAKSTTPAGQKPLTVAPDQIRVRVLNGSGVNGRARQVADELAKMGFVIAGVGSAPTSSVAVTTVSAEPSRSESARTLAFAAQTTAVDSSASGRTLVLVIGKDWKGVRAVVVPTSSGSSSAPSVRSADQSTCVG
jgi:LCP family protein required for cell wall assembly